MARYLVTGGAGFIGSNIVEQLLARGETVRVLDNFATGRRENLLPWQGRFELVEGDVRDAAAVRAAVDGVEFVLHQAALPSVARSVADPFSTNQVNVEGTVKLLIAAREAGVKRVVYAGSSSAYGDTPTLPKVEDMAPLPKSPYAVSKLAAEYYCLSFYKVFGLETVCFRYFNIFGPRQNPKAQYAAVVPLFLSALMKGEPPVIEGDGEQTRDFTFVADCVEANLLACQAEKAVGEVINIAGGKEQSILDLLRFSQQITGCTLAARHVEPRPGDVRRSRADISKARRLLGWEPKVSLEQGLQQVAQWMKQGGG